MKKFTFLFLLILLSQAAFAQKTRPRAPRRTNPAAKTAGNEKEALDKAVAQTDKAERVNALRKFTADFPKSGEKTRVSELLVSTLAALADEKMQAGDTQNGIELFKRAVSDAPKPVSDKLFTEILLQIPNSLFLRGQTAAAVETTRIIETKIDDNAKQTLALAGFYLTLENSSEAKRLAEKSLALEPDLTAAYQTLGLAERLGFEFENSVAAYQKALELGADSTISKRSLAEMKRAVGKPSEAVALYREILEKNPADSGAQTGLILALFDEEKRPEAEAEMEKSLAANPNNLLLLVGAAYWYAAHNDGVRAVDLAGKAIAVEPRYIWAHIAMAEGLIIQKRPLEAEKTLLTARQYGNFPTLEYELAAVRFRSGFYREAAEGLAKSFTIKDGSIEAKLGGRVSKEANNFIDLLSPERRAGIFEPLAADDAENADQLKSLLDFYQTLQIAANEATINAKADEFIKGDDRMKIHRQLFVADSLLNKKSNLPKVLELSKAAVSGVDASLNVENPSSAVLADELYESRRTAISRGEIIIVPEVARQTLSNILRGRIEDLAGWTLFQQNKPAEAVVRLKRAVSILPEKSSWWRDAEWRLGTALEFSGNFKDALDAYVKSYTNSEPNAVRYSVVQAVYQKINGTTDGLETKIGAKPDSVTADFSAPNTVKTAPSIVPEAIVAPPTETKPLPPEIARTAPEPEKEIAPQPEKKIEETKIVEPAPVPDVAPTVVRTPPKTVPRNAPVSSANSSRIVTRDASTFKAPPAEPVQKSLFEPIIITVPNAQNNAPKPSANDNGEARVRVVETVKESDAPTIAPCRILVNQEVASILGDGGSLALIAEIAGAGEVKDITATSSSPADVIAVFDSEIGGINKRALFVVKSISQKQGAFTVTFELPCGKKEVAVSVR